MTVGTNKKVLGTIVVALMLLAGLLPFCCDSAQASIPTWEKGQKWAVAGEKDIGEVYESMRFAFEDHPAGTAGAVKLLEKELGATIVVVSGDVLADVDIRSLVATHRRKGALATMALTTVDRPEEFGIVGLDDEGRIVRFKEKPKTEEVFSNLINAGIYVLDKRALQYIPEGERYDFSKQLFPKLLERSEPLYGMMLAVRPRSLGSRLITFTRSEDG